MMLKMVLIIILCCIRYKIILFVEILNVGYQLASVHLWNRYEKLKTLFVTFPNNIESRNNNEEAIFAKFPAPVRQVDMKHLYSICVISYVYELSYY